MTRSNPRRHEQLNLPSVYLSLEVPTFQQHCYLTHGILQNKIYFRIKFVFVFVLIILITIFFLTCRSFHCMCRYPETRYPESKTIRVFHVSSIKLTILKWERVNWSLWGYTVININYFSHYKCWCYFKCHLTWKNEVSAYYDNKIVSCEAVCYDTWDRHL